MRIGINLVQYTSLQGIEVFIQNIISNIEIEDNDSLVLFVNSKSAELFSGLNKKARVRTEKIPRLNNLGLIFYQQFGLVRSLKEERIDILFCPSLALPLFFKNKIVTIHDLAFRRFPSEANLFSRLYLNLALLSAKYLSLKITTVSEFSKNEIIKFLKINPEKISVLPEGAPALFKISAEEENEILRSFDLISNGETKKYFIYIGNIRARKNLKRIIEAFASFSKNNPDYLFLVAGKENRNLLKLRARVKKMGIEEKIIFTGFISQNEKSALLKNSQALIFVSLYEGFGLPILEAQSLGIPVLSSNTSALPETAGAGALFVSPENLEEIKNGLKTISQDINRRAEIISAGTSNLNKYSWKICAAKLIAIIKSYENS